MQIEIETTALLTATTIIIIKIIHRVHYNTIEIVWTKDIEFEIFWSNYLGLLIKFHAYSCAFVCKWWLEHFAHLLSASIKMYLFHSVSYIQNVSNEWHDLWWKRGAFIELTYVMHLVWLMCFVERIRCERTMIFAHSQRPSRERQSPNRTANTPSHEIQLWWRYLSRYLIFCETTAVYDKNVNKTLQTAASARARRDDNSVSILIK